MPRSLFTRVVSTLAAVGVGAGLALTAPGVAQAAPKSAPLPVEFDMGRYQAVNPNAYRSLAYVDNGRSFFLTGRWMCQIGPKDRHVACKGRAGVGRVVPATAPRDAIGAAISADQQGPWWVINGQLGTSYRFGPPSGMRIRTLGVGKRLTVGTVTCTVPRPGAVACRTGERGMILTPAWHKFFYPSWDTAAPDNTGVGHSPNPAPRYLPPRLQYWNQLPAGVGR